MAAFTAGFFDQTDIGYGHFAVMGFTHVVYGQGRYGHGGQGFHLHAGLRGDLGNAEQLDRVFVRLQHRLYSHTVQGDGVTQRQQ